MTRRRRTLIAAGAAALVLAGCSAEEGAAPAPSAPVPSATAPTSAAPSSTPSPGASGSASGSAGAPDDVAASVLAAGLTAPWGLAPLSDGGVLVSERDSRRILRVDADGASSVLTEVEQARPQGEGGLLGLALDDAEETLFVYLTAEQDNRVLAMSWDGEELGAPEPVLTGIPKGTRHDGGRLAVGPDGMLWVGTGDAGRDGLAQDRDSLAGKILRIAPDGAVPEDNPFGTPVWSWGHRNVQGLAFDPDGRLWASEFGANDADELNLIERGANYGWPRVEGSGGGEGLVDPVLTWDTDDASPSGLTWWRDSLWMASLRGERLWQVPVDGAEAGEPIARFEGEYGRLRSVAATADGEALLLSQSNGDGRGAMGPDGDQLLRVVAD